jgi:hypothetical protein
MCDDVGNPCRSNSAGASVFPDDSGDLTSSQSKSSLEIYGAEELILEAGALHVFNGHEHQGLS